MNMKHVVIAGAGFGGVRLARKLRKQKDVVVTLINDSPEFRYCPALYRAATGHKMGAARLSLEWMLLDATNVNLVVGKVAGIDSKKKFLNLENGTQITYDYVVFALGSVTTYFNIEGLHKHSVGVKTTEEILALRQHVHENVVSGQTEEANYVVVGAGPTGVEMAASLGAYLKNIAKKHNRPDHHIAIWLVEGADRVLPQNSVKVSSAVEKRLSKLGVKLLTNTMVGGESLHELKTSSATIKTHTVVWTAGSVVNPFYKDQGSTFKFNKRGKVLVSEHLEALPNVYVIGDNADTEYSGLALTAIRHANYVAGDIKRRIHTKGRKHHRDKKPIQVIPVGERWAIMQFGMIVLYGRIIYLLRKVADLIGYADILGYLRAITIWSHADRPENGCQVCNQSK